MTRHTRPTRLSSAMRVALSSFLLASISHTAQAEDAVTLCSCSPTTFQFVLSLDQNCDQNDLDGNAGIDGSLCFLEEGVALPAAPDLEQSDDEADGPIRRVLYRALQDTDPIVEIVSVQFLEFDTSGDLVVINQDDTYADVSLGDGALLNFTSASSFLDTSIPLEDQTSSPALVAGGASMILYGKTASGNIVRNRIIWIYDMNCGRDNSPVNTGDEIGWVTVGDLSNAWPAFCPALPEGSPTIAPKSNEPTDSPTTSPIRSPSVSPIKSPTMSPTEKVEEPMCSCSPTIFQFVLSLDQTCDQNDIADNTGIDGSLCFLEEGVSLPSAPGLEEAAEETDTGTVIDDGQVRRVLSRALQDSDPVVEIVSVQFLEFDTSGDLVVINQDDTYADVSLGDGAVLDFTSASSFLDTSIPLEDQMGLEETSGPALVTGGTSLIIYGKTASGNIIRNRFLWIYDMNCGRDNAPVQTGDEIGWVTVGELANAWPAFCPALPEGSPTIGPKTNEPTETPTVSPIKSPTLSPNDGPGPIFSAKSSKMSKTQKASKQTKSSKSSKSSKSQVAKDAKGAKTVKSSKSVKGKTSKASDDHSLYENTGKVTGIKVERANSGSRLHSVGLGLVTTLVACYLFARQ